MVGGVDTTNGATLTGSTTSWNALAGNGLGDTFNGGTGQFSPFIALQGDVFGVGAGPATVNLAAGHSGNHIDVYGTVGDADGAGGVLNYTPVPNSITSSGAFLVFNADIAQIGWEGNAGANTVQGGVNNAVLAGAFGEAGTAASEVVVNGPFVTGPVFPPSVGVTGDTIYFASDAWGTGPILSGQTDGNAIGGLTFGNAETRVPIVGNFAAFSGTPVQGGQTIGAGVDLVELNVNQSSPLALAQYLHGNPILFNGAGGLLPFTDVHMLWAYSDAPTCTSRTWSLATKQQPPNTTRVLFKRFRFRTSSSWWVCRR